MQRQGLFTQQERNKPLKLRIYIFFFNTIFDLCFEVILCAKLSCSYLRIKLKMKEHRFTRMFSPLQKYATIFSVGR